MKFSAGTNLLFLLIAFLLASCGGQEEEAPVTSTETPAAVSQPESAPAETTTMAPAPAKAPQKAKAPAPAKTPVPAPVAKEPEPTKSPEPAPVKASAFPTEDQKYVPTAIVLVESNDASNVISWLPVNENATYNIYWSTSPNVSKTSGNKIHGAVSPQTHTGVINGTKYYYVVTEVLNGVESKETTPIGATPTVPGDPIAGKKKSQLCQGCHGEDGNSADSDIPKLAGQYAKYIAKQLRNYQSGTRTHAIMSSMAATISDQDLADISAHFAVQPKMKGKGSNNPIAMNLFLNGDKTRKLLACVNCHGVNGKGLTPNTAMFPVIGGQYRDYIRAQLYSFRKGYRTNSPNGIMNMVTRSMTDEEIEALAEYVSGL